MKQVSRNVYVETGLRGCNVGFLVTTSGIVMIDTPQKPTEVLEWQKELRAKGEVRYIINTEPHPDHFTGNYFFKAPVLAQEGTRNAMSKFPLQVLIDRTNELDPQGRPLMDGYRIRLPEITFSDRLDIHLGEHKIELLHMPGHTSSETAVYIPQERVVFAADNVVHKVKAWLHDAVPEQWLESLRQLSKLEVDVIVPGHGEEMCSKEYLSQQAIVINRWVEAAKSAIKAGLNEEQALANIGNPDPFPMPKGREAMAPQVNKMIIEHLFRLYRK